MPTVTAATFDSVHALAEAEICNRALYRIGADEIRDTDESTKQARLCRSIYAATRDELIRMNPWNFAQRSDLIPQDSLYPYETDANEYAYTLDDRTTIAAGTTATSATISAVTASSLFAEFVGRRITATGIAESLGAHIATINDTTHVITMDRAATASGTVALTIYIPVLKVLEVGNGPDAKYKVVGGGSERRILTLDVTENVSSINYLRMRYLRRVVDPSQFDSMFTDALVLRIASKIAMAIAQDKNIVSFIQAEFAAVMKMAQNASSEERQIDESEGWWTDREIGVSPAQRDQ